MVFEDAATLVPSGATAIGVRGKESDPNRSRRELTIRTLMLAQAYDLAQVAELDSEGESALADILIGQRARFEKLHSSLRDLPRAQRKSAMRAKFSLLQGWHLNQLNSRFGAKAAQSILAPRAGAGELITQ